MRIVLLAICFLLLPSGVPGQDDGQDDRDERSWLRKDYNNVNIVAHIRFGSIKFAWSDVHPFYVVHCEIIEQFKGKLKRGQQFEYYMSADESYDVNRLIGKEMIVFLEGRFPTPLGGKGWVAMINSMRPTTTRNVAEMRKAKAAKQKRKRVHARTTSALHAIFLGVNATRPPLATDIQS